MTIVVTGATGQLGRLIVKHLLERVPSSEVVGSVRTPEQAGDLGIEVRHGDFDRPETLPAAFAGADKLLIISTAGEDSVRLRQHTAAVDAAKAAGVKHILYTSLTAADTNGISLANTHRPTEEAIKATGIPFTFLRNNWYFENDLGTVAGALATGSIANSSQGGRFAPAAREDYARAAAVVLTTEGHENAIYELGGPVSYSYADWAAAIAEASGKEITYQEITPEQATAGLAAAGVPEHMVGLIVDFYATLARGEMDLPREDLRKLIGRDPVSLKEFVASAVH
ncbi:SDR family oxidoreductase [Amycolatopsis sp. NPDC059657]|uniref:SDR family oxidoreductase n=1 Tax=Amycolatopsis sp. NPDC059657 TaxID=3346899 RepID=UPI00366AD6D1